MCPPVDDAPTTNGNATDGANGVNGHANGANGTNGSHPGFTAVETRQNPHPHMQANPYAPVGDFLSNISRFKIIESTLREGEQFANAFFDTETKIKIARALDDFGVDYIELTSPAASEQSRKDCEAICKLGLKAKILTHVRCHMDDARIAVRTHALAQVVIGTSAHLREHSHGKDMTYIKNTAIEVIEFVKSKGLEIRFSSEDSFRSDLVDLLTIYSAVDKVGVNRVGIADTVGCATPRQVYDLVRTLRGVVSCDIETHFHNDTGCAIANAYCALEAGATHVDTSVIGIGERNGITPLGGLMARMIVADRDYVKGKYKLEKLKEIEDLVAEAVQINIPFNNYITGFCAFTHKAGIHAKAILNNPSTYEIITPSDFGMSRYVHFASRLTGWNAIKSRVDQLGLQMTDAQVKAVTVKIKAMADVRPLAIDDADSIIRSFHFNLHNDVEKPLLPNMTEQEKEKFEKAQKEIAAEPEKRELDETVDKEAEVPRAKKTKTSIAA
ncbi:homocitrate synthase, mitochondrial [Coniosporium apollinis CBS 100218]|uniref:homocitrate synthase n=1 Tax=Coniosporium apollinis (strain CBS 100218) TaxID=1168221 RepID=R7Z1U8_CONA1|nr:homocitrate synthase, mitochondrial [Coniosporium apollinis CBS 100218]EON67906.1 homocitrate synthase, mitochondrial [Coniosporium apollinis CBS 100218]